ncbi:hypothetical protein, partial [Burkholderia cenocepacia]|uniref:hypothetical protein n=1 Tax=Burkholderia cenocepacia TaxID=95486 RepID=UPI003AF273A8
PVARRQHRFRNRSPEAACGPRYQPDFRHFPLLDRGETMKMNDYSLINMGDISILHDLHRPA